MKEVYARTLVEASEGTEHELTLYGEYSGRGMFGETTWAVYGERSHFSRHAAKAAVEFDDIYEEGADFRAAMFSITIDSLGLDTIFY